MRHVVAAVAVLSLSAPAFAAEVPADLREFARRADVTGSDLSKHVSGLVKETVARRRVANAQFATSAPLPGWTITQVGNTVFVQDDGTHGCDGELSNAWFESCVAGTNSAVDAFYAYFPEANPHFVSTYLAWDIEQFFAFYSPVANDVDGIGEPTYGNANSLNGFIFMNSVQLYDAYGASYREFMFDLLWGQEFGHRWGAFIRFDDNGTPSKALLGRDEGHWSYFVDSDWSWMEGNDWRDNGDGSFTTDFGTFGQPGYGYSQLDLYLMGMIPASGVQDFFLIENPSGSNDPEDPPQIMMGDEKTITGKRRDVSIYDVIAVEGDRAPAFDDTKRHFQVANLVILRSTDNPAAQSLKDVMGQFTEWTTTHFTRDTMELGYVETTIGAPLANAAPNATFTLSAPEAKAKGAAVTLDASGSSDPESEKLSYVWDFGDGTADYLSGSTVEHVFKTHGDLSVRLTVVDARGKYHSASQSISVSPADKKGGDSPIGCNVSGFGGSSAASGLVALGGALAAWIRRRRT